MKKILFTTLSIITAVVLVTFGTRYLLSLHRVSFVFQNGATGATIYRSDKQKIRSIAPNGNILLKKGSYYAVPEGTNLSQDPINFTVKDKDMAVTIDPAYSESYLKSLLVKEKPAISAAIAAKYPSVFAAYTLVQERLYKRGDWAGGLLRPKISDPRDQKDPYRVVLYKQNNAWQIIRRPEYILTSSKYENVPIDVLRAINLITL